MENASKALIIAGSVLIAILVITLGLYIIKSTQGATKQTQNLGETLTVQQFNSQFLKYCGTLVKGSQVRTLCEVIIAHNANSKNKVKINGHEDAGSIATYRSSIKTNGSYNVTEYYDNAGGSGLIGNITVTQ